MHRDNAGIPTAANAGLAECRGGVRGPHRRGRHRQAHAGLTSNCLTCDQHDLVACGTWHDLIDEHGRFLRVPATPVDNEVDPARGVAGPRHDLQPDVDDPPAGDAWIWTGTATICPVPKTWTCGCGWARYGRLGNLPVSLTQYRLHSNSISERKCELQRSSGEDGLRAGVGTAGHRLASFEAEAMWRPGEDRGSRAPLRDRIRLVGVSTAARSGTARAYAQRALRLKPWDPTGYQAHDGRALLRPRGGKPI